MSGPIYIFAGGGTGGHLFPALAVAEELTSLQSDARPPNREVRDLEPPRIVFACSDRDIDWRILSPTAHAVVPQPIRPLPRGWRGWGAFLARLYQADRLARDLLGDLRPAAVLGLGGFAAVPVVRAAAKTGIRSALLSIDALPGLANRYLARKVEVVFAQFERTAAEFGRCAGKVQVVGCPVRKALLSPGTGEARAALGLRDDRKTLLAMAGSLGAENINQALAAIAPELEELSGQWQLLHLVGPGRGADVPGGGGKMHRVVQEFCARMDLAYAAADVVLCRAGASTIGELTATAKPAVLMPYPYHRDQHQRHNAEPLTAAGAAVVVTDACDPRSNAEALRRRLLPILREPQRLEAMRRSAAGLARPGAAAAVARWLAG